MANKYFTPQMQYAFEQDGEIMMYGDSYTQSVEIMVTDERKSIRKSITFFATINNRSSEGRTIAYCDTPDEIESTLLEIISRYPDDIDNWGTFSRFGTKPPSPDAPDGTTNDTPQDDDLATDTLIAEIEIDESTDDTIYSEIIEWMQAELSRIEQENTPAKRAQHQNAIHATFSAWVSGHSHEGITLPTPTRIDDSDIAMLYDMGDGVSVMVMMADNGDMQIVVLNDDAPAPYLNANDEHIMPTIEDLREHYNAHVMSVSNWARSRPSLWKSFMGHVVACAIGIPF